MQCLDDISHVLLRGQTEEAGIVFQVPILHPQLDDGGDQDRVVDQVEGDDVIDPLPGDGDPLDRWRIGHGGFALGGAKA